MHQPVALPSPYPHVFAEPVRPVLQDRTLGGQVRLPGRSWQVLLLSSGRADVLVPDRDGPPTAPRPVQGPALVWWPAVPGLRFRVRAGSFGGHLAVDDTALAGAIGIRPEAEDLRLMVARPVILPLDRTPAARATADAAVELIRAEIATSERGGDLVIEAQLRVLLVLMWRHAALPPGPVGGTGSSLRLLQAFRQSVEAHFRDRWTVTDHARALGLTPDRLHDLCIRTLGKPPQRLIHDRLAHEARLMLTRSSATLDQVSGALGFAHAGHFSRFFRGMEGVPPGQWRRDRAAERRAGTEPARPEGSYADWP
jgi:AraC family transcriptional regulator, transcriptional activator of pobA